jgi:hypothetical protein
MPRERGVEIKANRAPLLVEASWSELSAEIRHSFLPFNDMPVTNVISTSHPRCLGPRDLWARTVSVNAYAEFAVPSKL